MIYGACRLHSGDWTSTSLREGLVQRVCPKDGTSTSLREGLVQRVCPKDGTSTSLREGPGQRVCLERRPYLRRRSSLPWQATHLAASGLASSLPSGTSFPQSTQV